MSFRLTYSVINDQSFTHLVVGTYERAKLGSVFLKLYLQKSTKSNS